ncbi:hypothetical protein KPL74_15555 [Bacillus sp. NP157]|nr:hypothetical protein KPL74_15555 [Bacillus sp. NP157]
MNALNLATTTALALACLSPSTRAAPGDDQVVPYEIKLMKGAGNVAVFLAHDAEVHVEALRKGVAVTQATTSYANTPVPVRGNHNFRKQLAAKARGATLARLDYRSAATGETIRVHARSGASIERTIQQVAGRRSQGATSGSESEAGAQISPAEALADARDVQFYPPSDIRATNMRQRDNWVVEPSAETEGPRKGEIIHGTDAELKALRQLEFEFEKNPGLSVAGGEVTGYVSKTVCHSCDAAFKAFARKYKVSGTIYYLDETSVKDSATLADTVGDDITAASRASSAVLSRIRKDLGWQRLVESEVDPDAASWSGPYDVERLAAAEAGELTASERCLSD